MSDNKNLKPGWKIWRFDQVAHNISERGEPTPADSEFYVGLEHMDSGSLRIRRWGSDTDLIGTKFRMRRGDILFARRNAYLKRVAIAPHDGLFSAHGMVLRANPEVVLPEFLPLFMQSDLFMDRAVEISVGSLSPTINWKTLAAQEFALPSLAEQRKLAELLTSANELADNLEDTAFCLKTVTQAAIDDFFGSGFRQGPRLISSEAKASAGWTCISGTDLLAEGYVLALQDGNHGSQYPRSDELGNVGYPYVAASDISDDGELDLRKVRRLGVDRANKLRIPPAMAGDVILTHNATVGRVAILPPFDDPVVASTSTTYYRPNPKKLTNVVLASLMRSSFFQAQLRSYMRQSTRNQVPITTQKRMHFLIPPMAAQLRFQELASELQLQKDRIKSRLEEARLMTLKLSRELLQ